MRTRKIKRRTAKRTTFLGLEQLEERTVLSAGIGTFSPLNDTFTFRNTATGGAADVTFQLSAPGALPVVGDWNGDGTDDFGIFDSKTATWSLKYGTASGTANAGVFPFGKPGTLPVVGDWNGDGRDDIGTFDPRTATWSLRVGASPGPANAGTFVFGAKNSQPVVGDWNGDGTDGIGTYVSSSGTWTLRQTANAGAANAGTFKFGPTGGVIAVTGDWNGDGKDGIGTFITAATQWSLRQTANAGKVDAGNFKFGSRLTVPVAGQFKAPVAPTNALAQVVLPPVDLNLLGVEVNTSPITVTITTEAGSGKLLGNLLNTVSTLVDLKGASSAVNQVLSSTVNLLNSAKLNVGGLISGPLDSKAAGAAQVLELFVAPVHLDLLGVHVDTSTVRVTVTTHSGQGLVLGNAVTELINLFNPPLPQTLDVNVLNTKLSQLLDKLNVQLPGIAPAPVPAVPISDGQILNVTVPPLDLNLLGLVLQTSPITVNASAQSAPGALLGNVLTTALHTLGATPQNLSQLSTNINAVLAKVIGVLNASNLTLSTSAINALPPLIKTLVSPTLTAPAAGSTAPVLDLLIASTDGTTPPVDVNLLGLSITTSNIEAHLSAKTGDGQVLGNLLYNLANLADPGGPAGLLNLLNLLGAGSLNSPGTTAGGSVSPALGTPTDLLTVTVKPLHLDLLGLQVNSDPIVVNVATQTGDGKLLGNLLTGITTLINVDGVNTALNKVLATTIDIVNSASLAVNGVGSGTFDTSPTESITPVLDLFVAPVHLDLLGLVATTQPIHLTITAHSGNGLVLGNVIAELAHIFDPPLPATLNIDDLNARLQDLINRLNAQIPGIAPAPSPPVNLAANQFLQLTVPQLDVNLLGLELQSTPITVNAYSQTGDGLLVGNILTTVLNTVGATRQNLTGLNTNLNALLAKVVGVLNATTLVIPADTLSLLPPVLQTLADPLLISPTAGATTPVLDLIINSNSTAGPPVDVNLLGLEVTTSNIRARLIAKTGNGQLLGNLVFNVAHLLDPGSSTTLLSLLAQLSRLV